MRMWVINLPHWLSVDPLTQSVCPQHRPCQSVGACTAAKLEDYGGRVLSNFAIALWAVIGRQIRRLRLQVHDRGAAGDR